MKKILVTGASGFIGRRCVPLLAQKGYEVHAVSRRSNSKPPHPNVFRHELDLLSPGRATQLIRQIKPNAALHLAWYTEPGAFWEAKENVEWVRASLELLSAFADNGGKRIVAAGSCAEYISSAGECLENSTPLVPATLYGTCKHALERILTCFSLQSKLSSAWGRAFFIYGPGEHPSRLVAQVVRSLLQGEPALCSEGKQVLDFMYIEDVAVAFTALLESEVQGPVNIASGRPVAVRDVLQEIGLQLGRLDLIRFGACPPQSDTERLWAKTQRLEKEVGWVPQYSLAHGIRQTIQWWQKSFGIAKSDSIEFERK
jgi:nucleoside-diphosphate-sugar epimerase